jgi:hypothetical protein
VYALATYGPEVYAGGSFTLIGGQTRNHVALIDPAGAATFTWDPNANSDVYSLLTIDGALYIGGNFNLVDGLGQVGLASFNAPNTVGVPLAPRASRLELRSAPNPARVDADIHFALPESGPVSLEVYDAAGRRVAALIDDQWLTAGPHTVGFATGALKSGFYFARLRAGFDSATQKLMVIH